LFSKIRTKYNVSSLIQCALRVVHSSNFLAQACIEVNFASLGKHVEDKKIALIYFLTDPLDTSGELAFLNFWRICISFFRFHASGWFPNILAEFVKVENFGALACN
jgi:hypothetical protein